MTVIDEYALTLHGAEQATVMHMYDVIRKAAPDVTEGISYAMPSFLYEGKGLVAIMANKDFLSLYPFCSIERLGLELGDFEQTKGSIHFTVSKQIPDDLLRRIVAARKQLIAG